MRDDTRPGRPARRAGHSPPQAPQANAICERLIGTLRRELLDRLLILSEHHLRQVLTEDLQHYNTSRPHRAFQQLPPAQAGSQPPHQPGAHRIRDTKSSAASPASTTAPRDHASALKRSRHRL